jgi:transcriptional regulator with XRE-family HTH domain
MGKRIAAAAPAEQEVSFGERLAGLRKAAGFTQIELAAELGVSQRMVAYYESPAATPPANLLPQIATVLGVSIDEMFGRSQKRKLVKQEGDSRLRRRLLAIEKLDVADKRQVLQVIDAFIERGQLRRKAESRA